MCMYPGCLLLVYGACSSQTFMICPLWLLRAKLMSSLRSLHALNSQDISLAPGFYSLILAIYLVCVLLLLLGVELKTYIVVFILHVSNINIPSLVYFSCYFLRLGIIFIITFTSCHFWITSLLRSLDYFLITLDFKYILNQSPVLLPVIIQMPFSLACNC